MPWADALDSARYEGLKQCVDHALKQEHHSLVIEQRQTNMWQLAMWGCGYEQYFIYMVTELAIFHAIMSKELKTTRIC